MNIDITSIVKLLLQYYYTGRLYRHIICRCAPLSNYCGLWLTYFTVRDVGCEFGRTKDKSAASIGRVKSLDDGKCM